MIKDMGLDNFSKMQKETLANGHRLHSAIENFFLNGSLVLPEKDLQVVKNMENTSLNHLNSIAPVIENFHRPALALESQVSNYFAHSVEKRKNYSHL